VLLGSRARRASGRYGVASYVNRNPEELSTEEPSPAYTTPGSGEVAVRENGFNADPPCRHASIRRRPPLPIWVRYKRRFLRRVHERPARARNVARDQTPAVPLKNAGSVWWDCLEPEERWHMVEDAARWRNATKDPDKRAGRCGARLWDLPGRAAFARVRSFTMRAHHVLLDRARRREKRGRPLFAIMFA